MSNKDDEKKKKKPESFASIFGDDYDEKPVAPDEGTTTIKLEQLVPFANHPFKLYEGERFNEMVESIKNFGVIVPIVARKKGLKFEILSGHNRVNAAKDAGLKEVPTVLKEGLTEDEAMLIVTETNLMQRSFTDLAHSERAKVIATRHNAMKKQGVRNDLLGEIEKLSKAPNLASKETLSPMDTKLDSMKDVGTEYNLSRASVARYLRIDRLNPELKDQVDDGKIAMRAGVDLSYLSKENQEIIDAIVSEDTFKVDMKKAAMIRKLDKEGNLTWKAAKDIITGEAMKDPNKQKPLKVKPEIWTKFFKPEDDKKDIEQTIEKALDFYFTNQETQGNEDDIESEEGDDMLE
jgi:ParB family chromosome partitioning protein